MNIRKALVYGLLMSFGLAIYRVWFEQPYYDQLEASGKGVGVGETAIGFFGAWVIIMIITYFVTRNMGAEHT